MRHLIIFILFLRFFGQEVYSQYYLHLRDNVFDSTSEFYVINSPTNVIGNSRVGFSMQDSVFFKFWFNRVHFLRYDSSRNDGVPSSILWLNNKGMTMRSPISSLGIPDTTSLSNRINNKLNTSDTTNKWQPKGTYLSSESDPIYTSGIVNYYTKTQADSRYLQSETDPQFNTKFATKTTTDLTEGANLYYTNTRARSAFSAGTGISYNSSTGVITNSSPDQTVSVSSGSGISVTGTYPSFTITNTSPSTAALYDKTGLLSNSYVAFTDTFAITSAVQTISLSSYMSTAGKSNMRIKAVTGVRITGSPTAQGSPQVSISGITSNSVTVVCTQANPATVTILGINVLSGLPLVLLSDFTATKVVIDAVFY